MFSNGGKSSEMSEDKIVSISSKNEKVSTGDDSSERESSGNQYTLQGKCRTCGDTADSTKFTSTKEKVEMYEQHIISNLCPKCVQTHYVDKLPTRTKTISPTSDGTDIKVSKSHEIYTKSSISPPISRHQIAQTDASNSSVISQIVHSPGKPKVHCSIPSIDISQHQPSPSSDCSHHTSPLPVVDLPHTHTSTLPAVDLPSHTSSLPAADATFQSKSQDISIIISSEESRSSHSEPKPLCDDDFTKQYEAVTAPLSNLFYETNIELLKNAKILSEREASKQKSECESHSQDRLWLSLDTRRGGHTPLSPRSSNGSICSFRSSNADSAVDVLTPDDDGLEYIVPDCAQHPSESVDWFNNPKCSASQSSAKARPGDELPVNQSTPVPSIPSVVISDHSEPVEMIEKTAATGVCNGDGRDVGQRDGVSAATEAVVC